MLSQQVFSKPCLQVVEERQQNDCLKLNVTIREITNQFASESSAHKINPSISVHVKVLFVKATHVQNIGFGVNRQMNAIKYHNFVFFKFVKNNMLDNTLYSITCTSNDLNLCDKTYLTDNDSWYLVKETESSSLTFDVVFTSRIMKNSNSFEILYDDIELADFKLVGEGGEIVKIHGAVLAAQCPSVMKMISDKSIKEGVIEYSDFHRETLQNFKDYLYLHTLPDNNITKLLLLASKVGMPVLEEQCIKKIINTLTAANIYELTEFSQKHKLYDLFITILDHVQNRKIKVEDIRKCMSDV